MLYRKFHQDADTSTLYNSMYPTSDLTLNMHVRLAWDLYLKKDIEMLESVQKLPYEFVLSSGMLVTLHCVVTSLSQPSLPKESYVQNYTQSCRLP